MADNIKIGRTLSQIVLLTSGFLILTAIGAISVYLVDAARTESNSVVHTIEVENQISRVLLDLRRIESSARGYLLTQNKQFLTEYSSAVATVMPAVEALAGLTNDNPTQVRNISDLRSATEARLKELKVSVDLINRNDIPAAMDMIRNSGTPDTTNRVRDISNNMQAEEERLFALRSDSADRSRYLSAVFTIAGAALLVLLGGVSVFLIRQSSKERDLAEQRLRDNNLNLETIVEERTADLREANEEIQRFAYIVSHDLRSPLVNIMGFTSELEELKSDIFGRLTKLYATASPSVANETGGSLLHDADKKLAEEFSEAIDYIKSSISRMDRLISAILNLTREGRREFRPEPINMRQLIQGLSTTMAHQALEAGAKIVVEELPDIVTDRLAMEQIFSNLIDNALKYLAPGTQGNIVIRGRRKLGFAIFEVSDNGRGIDPKDHQRIFDLFRRAGVQDRPGQGIGLAHVRALVRRLGGAMSVDSELGKGSTFVVTLPANQGFKEGPYS